MDFKNIIIICILSTGSSADIISSRIIGGDSASSSTATYLVSIQNAEWVHVCAGAIIDTRWVLTSASCALNEGSKNVVTGVSTLVDGKPPNIAYHVSRTAAHPDFIEGEPFNNIGMIRTLQTFVYTTTLRALPWSTSNLGANQQLTIIGWDLSAKAATKNSSPVSESSSTTTTVASYRLKSLTLTSLTNDQCQKDSADGSVIETSHLCGLRSAGRGTCVGDDGLVVVSGGRIQGIVGAGPATAADCAKGYPEIYTRVSSFSSWISAERARNY